MEAYTIAESGTDPAAAAAPPATTATVGGDAAVITATPTEPPKDEPIVGDGLKFRDNWRELLSDDIKADPLIADFKDLNGLVKTVVNQQKMIGLDKVAVPTGNSSEAVWNEFYHKIGRPENSAGYELADPEQIPDGMEISKELNSQFKELAFNLGLTPKQAQGLYDFYNAKQEEAFKNATAIQNKEYEDAVQSVREEFGLAYDARLALAERTMDTFDPNGRLERAGLLNNPAVISLLAAVGDKISEASLVPPTASLTPNNAQTEINRIKASDAYKNAGNSKEEREAHKAALRQVEKLYAQLHPDVTTPTDTGTPASGQKARMFLPASL